MRTINVIKGDIRFQIKYGFYLLYFIMIILYMILLSMLSGDIKEIVTAVCVYSDPAAMGMFFMGAMALLEKTDTKQLLLPGWDCTLLKKSLST